MEEKNEMQGRLFSMLMQLDFFCGAAVFIYALTSVDGMIPKFGFAVMTVFSLLSAAGMSLLDTSSSDYFRRSTKIMAFLAPMLVFAAAFIAVLCLKNGITERIPIVAAAVCCTASAFMGSALLDRYRQDDF